MAGLLRKLLGRDDTTVAVAVARPAERPAQDDAAVEAVYERMVAAAMILRSLDTELGRAAESLTAREDRLRASVEEYDRIARAAIAGGRTIQAESALASSETAEAALAALAPRSGEIAALRSEAARAATRIEADAQALRLRIDTGSPTGDQARIVEAAENDAVRLTSLARALSV